MTTADILLAAILVVLLAQNAGGWVGRLQREYRHWRKMRRLKG